MEEVKFKKKHAQMLYWIIIRQCAVYYHLSDTLKLLGMDDVDIVRFNPIGPMISIRFLVHHSFMIHEMWDIPTLSQQSRDQPIWLIDV